MVTIALGRHGSRSQGAVVYPGGMPSSDVFYSYHGFVPTTLPSYLSATLRVTPRGTATSTDPAEAFEISGFLVGNRGTKYAPKGRYLERVLQDKGIDVEKPPAWHSLTSHCFYPNHGVVKIGNIPFTVSVLEVVQFIKRFSPVPMLKKNQEGCPIHIIMEKPTGKTMDCFVEFPTHSAARECVRSFEDTPHPGKGSKLGARNATLDLSNQAELMTAIFPRARLVRFDPRNGSPTVLDHSTDPTWSAGFRGYFTFEEAHGVTTFAEFPSKSPFVLKCPQRVYECLISTLYKFPWPSTTTYTIAARNALFDSTYRQLSILSRKVGVRAVPPIENNLASDRYNCSSQARFAFDPSALRTDNREVGLNQALLFDLLFAAVNVPAFSLLQKLALCRAAGSFGRGITLSTFSETWPFQTLAPDPDAADHVTKFWLELFDTGFDLGDSDGAQTTFEEYIVFSRNAVGFPIAEWTRKGVELSFDEATRVETAAMMCYVIRGRDAWATERQVQVSPWAPETIHDLVAAINAEKTQIDISAQRAADGLLDAASSTGTSTSRDVTFKEATRGQRAKELGAADGSSLHHETAQPANELTAVNVQDFVPDADSFIGSDPGVTSSGAVALANGRGSGLGRRRSACQPQSLRVDTRLPSPASDSVFTTFGFKNPFGSWGSNAGAPVRQSSADTTVSPLDSSGMTGPSSFANSQPPATASGGSVVGPTRVFLPCASRNASDARTSGPNRDRPAEQDRDCSLFSTAVDSGSTSTEANLAAQSFSASALVHGSWPLEKPGSDPFDNYAAEARRTQTWPDLCSNFTPRRYTSAFGPVGSGRASSVSLKTCADMAGDLAAGGPGDGAGDAEKRRAQSMQTHISLSLPDLCPDRAGFEAGAD